MTDEIVQELRLRRLRDREGHITAEMSYEVPSTVSAVTATIPAGSQVVTKHGFDPVSGSQLRWDGSASDPLVELEVPVNNTAGGVQNSQVDMGDWAIVSVPGVSLQWQSFGGSVSLRRETTIDDQGVASSDGALAYLGPYREFSGSAGGQLLRLIVPEEASLAEDPRDIIDSLEFAAGVLQVGGRNDEVIGIAAPTRPVSWGPGGLQAGANGFWVRDTAPIDTANNSWIHEYVHTRQEFATAPTTKWFVEATAVYFATKLTYQQRGISDAEYFVTLNTERCENDILGNPRKWTSAHVPYQKGSRIASWLDSRMTDLGGVELSEIMRSLNQASTEIEMTGSFVDILSKDHVDPIDHRRFTQMIEDELRGKSDSATLRSFISKVDELVHSTTVPDEHLPLGLDEKPEGDLPSPHMPKDLSDLIRESFGERFGAELLAGDGKLDEDSVFRSSEAHDDGLLSPSELFEVTEPDLDNVDISVRIHGDNGKANKGTER